jgi:broad specificity phosphatase PhoE
VIWLARHGETTSNKERRFQGQLDVPLNETGREQARALAERVRGEPLAALYASPLSRARETAEIVGEAIGLPVQLDERFKEVDVGDWQERLKDDIERDEPDAWKAFGAAARISASRAASHCSSSRSASSPRSSTSPSAASCPRWSSAIAA